MNPYQQGDTFNPRDIAWVLTDADLERCLEALRDADEITFDLETTGLDEHAKHARVAMASFTLPPHSHEGDPVTWVVPLSHPEGPFCGRWRAVLRRLAHVMESAGNLSAHNGKFDLRWIFASTDVDLSGHLVWDTQVVAHLLDENESTRLKVVAPRLFGVEAWNDGIDFGTEAAAERTPLFHLGEYAARDTYWTYRTKRVQQADLDTDEQPSTADEVEAVRLGKFVRWCVMPMTRNLAAVEQRGIALDGGWVRDQIALDEKTRDEAEATLLALNPMDGAPSFAPTSLWFRAWTEQAVERGQLRVDALTPNGKPQWSRHVLMRQARQGRSPLPGELLIYRQAVKRLEYLNAWLDLQAEDGRIHPRYNVGRVITGRLSSADPNMQQVTKTLKPAFVPTPGYYVAEIDYSQIELRAAAFVSRCVPMIEAYQRGDDLHTLMGAKVANKAPGDVTPEERQKAKAANFGLLYLQSPGGFRTYAETAYGVELTPEEAQETWAAFFEQWPGMYEWQMASIKRARATGQVVSPLGRVRRLPNILDGNPHMVGEAERQAVNSPVQSFASDLMQMAAADVMGQYGKPVPGVRMIGTVHDSLVVEVPADDWQRATARVMQRMLNPHHLLHRLDCDLDVPLGAEAQIGSRWGLSDIGKIVS